MDVSGVNGVTLRPSRLDSLELPAEYGGVSGKESSNSSVVFLQRVINLQVEYGSIRGGNGLLLFQLSSEGVGKVGRFLLPNPDCTAGSYLGKSSLNGFLVEEEYCDEVLDSTDH
jgi:hypothetical protein